MLKRKTSVLLQVVVCLGGKKGAVCFFPGYLGVLSVDLGGADSDNPGIVCLRFANLLFEFGDLLKSNFQLMWLTLQWFGFWEQFQQGWSNCVGSRLLKDSLTVFGFVGVLPKQEHDGVVVKGLVRG